MFINLEETVELNINMNSVNDLVITCRIQRLKKID